MSIVFIGPPSRRKTVDEAADRAAQRPRNCATPVIVVVTDPSRLLSFVFVSCCIVVGINNVVIVVVLLL
jgi:hypothetical protein